MTGSFKNATVAAVCVALAACGAVGGSDCDPTTGGLISAIRCDSSGAYDQRVEERKQQQAALEARRSELQQEQRDLEAEQAGTTADLQAKQAELQRAEADLDAVNKRLVNATGDKSALQQQAKSLERQIAGLKKDASSLRSSDLQKQSRLVQLRQEQADLDKEYSALIGKSK